MRGYWIIERVLYDALDVTLSEDQGLVRHPNATLVLRLFRRVVVSFAQVWLEEIRKIKRRTQASTRNLQNQFHHRNGVPERLHAPVRQISRFLPLQLRRLIRIASSWH